jgi:large-conductance mechanosensitive channel
MDWGKVFGNLLTLTVAFIAITFMVAIAIRAVRNITHNLNETKKKDVSKKDL